MLVDRSMHPQWFSNTYLVGDRSGGEAALIDAGGPVAPLLAAIKQHQLTLSYVLLTHHHFDHVAELDDVLAEYPDVPVLAHPVEEELISGCTGAIGPGSVVNVGELALEAIHTPGHTEGMLSFYIGDDGVFTGDTLFKGSVGGVRAPGSTSYTDLRNSIMDRLMKLPGETKIYPGHSEETTVQAEWEQNPFIRIWRGIDQPQEQPCRALGKPATLVLLAGDYDGGHKAWVRWQDGSDDIVPGSAIEL
jgi:glyoxylase-like metal-dependent hydrolase (beta-lactamase superfamily II)